jgi:hypothetical protein
MANFVCRRLLIRSVDHCEMGFEVSSEKLRVCGFGLAQKPPFRQIVLIPLSDPIFGQRENRKLSC